MVLASPCNTGFDATMEQEAARRDQSGIALLRTATVDDVDGVLALAQAWASGLTNLPPDRGMLAGRIVALSGIFPRVGAEWTFYSYRLTRQAGKSRAVGRAEAQTLRNLVNDFDGETEVGMLFVDLVMRGSAQGALAARGRYLFIAAHRPWLGQRVMAALRGWQDADGRSPVWEAIGRHFYDMDFCEADRTGALTRNLFIADLGPRYPLYLTLLPSSAQAALGRPHDEGKAAFDTLIAEGFRAGDYVDIFDGGPTVAADIDAVRTVREARRLTFSKSGAGSQRAPVAAGSGAAFRVARELVGPEGLVDTAPVNVLDLCVGDEMLVVAA